MPGTLGSATSLMVEGLHRFGLKLFVDADAVVSPHAYIPVFHRWIQTGSVDGLLIDVADYSNLADGPRVLLVAHEGNYAIDDSGGRPGLVYTRKQPLDGPFADRLDTVSRTLLGAARLLEMAQSFDTPSDIPRERDLADRERPPAGAERG